MKTDICTQGVLRSCEQSHTQIVVPSAATALDLLGDPQLSCCDIYQGPAVCAPWPPSCAHPNLSQVQVRETGVLSVTAI